jgi:hypothetical protein
LSPHTSDRLHRSLAGGHPANLNKEFPDDRFEQKLTSFCSALRQHLETTDREANWSPDYYADLEAEVEIVSSAGLPKMKRVANLQSALRNHHRTQSFLLLGDPGGGKSVALRRLAKGMLDEVDMTHRIPIYINLREWLLPIREGGKRSWTQDDPPSKQDLVKFVKGSLKSRGDIFTEEFVDTYFEDLWQKGHLFFLFDSFDEMPELLDLTDDSWLIDALSRQISALISTDPRSRGVLASRYFRGPTQSFLAQKELAIRPLSEYQMTQAFKRFKAFSSGLQAELFRQRPDLVPLARNPFLLALLGEWATENRHLPKSQAELYRSYLLGRLMRVGERMAGAGLERNAVVAAATEIAWFIFRSVEYGLEAPVKVLDSLPNLPAASSVIDLLRHARIARVTGGENPSFAFVHRRFLEYLVTTRLLAHPTDLPVGDIPTDSRGRDVMVLYAQICDETEAFRLARLCWSEIVENFDDPKSRLRAIHCLRFLKDAFGSRRSIVLPLVRPLADFVERNVSVGVQLVPAKICLECTGLLSDEQAAPIILTAMESKNEWLQETALRACRNLPRIDKELEDSIARYVYRIPLFRFWTSYPALKFALSLSEAFQGVLAVAKWRRANVISSAFALVGALVWAPLSVLGGLSYAGIPMVARYFTAAPRNPSPTEDENSATGAIDRVRWSANNMASAHQVVANWLRRMFLDPLEMGRHCAALALVTAGIIAIYRGNSGGVEIFSIGAVAGRTSVEVRAGICFVLAMLLVDWRPIWLIAREVAREPKETAKVVGFACLIMGISAVLGFGVFLAMQHLPVLTVVFAALTGVLGLGLMALSIRRLWHDRKAISAMNFSRGLNRDEIAGAFMRLQTNAGRLRYVRLLASAKVVATGEWPVGFALVVSADHALTELAQLEERWLKLDR